MNPDFIIAIKESEYEKIKSELEEYKKKYEELKEKTKEHNNIQIFRERLKIQNWQEFMDRFDNNDLEWHIHDFFEKIEEDFYVNELESLSSFSHIYTKAQNNIETLFSYLEKALNENKIHLLYAFLRSFDYASTVYDQTVGLFIDCFDGFPDITFGSILGAEIEDKEIETDDLKQFFIEMIPTFLSRFINKSKKDFNADQCFYMGESIDTNYERQDNSWSYSINGKYYLLLYNTPLYEAYFRVKIENDNSLSGNRVCLVHFVKR
jgi:hypothetical protein